MTDAAILERDAIGAAAKQRAAARADDKAMLKAAADLTRDLNVAKPSVYWSDLIGSALLGYADQMAKEDGHWRFRYRKIDRFIAG